MYLHLQFSFWLILWPHIHVSSVDKNFPVYFCDSVETINEITGIKIKRLFSHFTTIYVILPEKIIFFEMPIVVKTNTKDVFGLAVYQPHYQVNVDKSVGKQLIGYAGFGQVDNSSVILSEHTIYELYLDENKNQMAKEMYRLDFDKILGFRQHMIQTKKVVRPSSNEMKLEETHVQKLIDLSNYSKAGHFANYLFSDNDFIEVDTYPIDKNQYEGKVHYCKISKENLTQKRCESNTQKTNLFKTTHSIKMFATVQRSFKEWEGRDLNMFLIDNNNNVHISDKKIGFSGSKMVLKEDIRIEPLKFDELFGCSRKFRTEREIKGIYYSRSTETFYVFINRNYLKITTDLVPLGFQIEDHEYRNALSMKFMSKSASPTFEIMRTKWVKTLRQQAFLVTHFDTFCELNSNKFSQNDFLMSIEGNSIVKCDYQTLSIDDYVFCLDEKEYWYISPESKLQMTDFYRPGVKQKIMTIFENSPIDYDEDERLRFTFNYKKDNFVLMTTNYLFVLDYNRFTVSKEKVIVFNWRSGDKYPYYINHLLDNNGRLISIVKRLKKVIKWSIFVFILAFFASHVFMFVRRRRTSFKQIAMHPKMKFTYEKIFVTIGKLKKKEQNLLNQRKSPKEFAKESSSEFVEESNKIQSIHAPDAQSSKRKSNNRSTEPSRGYSNISKDQIQKEQKLKKSVKEKSIKKLLTETPEKSSKEPLDGEEFSEEQMSEFSRESSKEPFVEIGSTEDHNKREKRRLRSKSRSQSRSESRSIRISRSKSRRGRDTWIRKTKSSKPESDLKLSLIRLLLPKRSFSMSVRDKRNKRN